MTKNSENPKRTEVAAARGRPMLSWVGKKPLHHVPALPAQHIETYDPSADLSKIKPRTTWLDWPAEYPKSRLLFHGDNKEILAHLLSNGFRGRVNLIYIDPPFDSAANYVRKVELRGVKGKTGMQGESYSLGEQIQYADIWANDTYLQFMYERLLLMRELLAENGSIFLHCDNRKNHHLRMLCDEVFGTQAFMNELIWRSTTFTGSSKAIAQRFPTNHNTIFWYRKGDEYVFNKVREPYKEEYVARFTNPDDDPRGPWQSVSLKTYSQETFDRLKKEKRLIPPQRAGAGWRYKFYLEETKGKVVETLWLNEEATATSDEMVGYSLDEENVIPTTWLQINMANSMADERTGYPTEKPDALLERIVAACSNPGDIVLDAFLGSGTTACVAQRLGRRWIGCDINKGAVQTASKRLQRIIDEQTGAIEAPNLEGMEECPPASQLSLCVFRVNDYDLQVQHNEAVRIACEYIGVETKRSDSYFDGALGKTLVKIVPFNHPLSPIDLDDLKQELETRKDEGRDITLVCLGMEVAAQAWVDEWNRLRRKSGNVPNRIRVIELRTDPNYAGFLKHDPATAKIKVSRSRSNGTVSVVVEDFISPTIIKRLDMEQGLFQKKVKDWRSMVDCVMIDPAYDGQVFNVALSDVPEKKNDLVAGEYEVGGPDGKGKTTVAVKIIDMLGEEVLVTKEV